ncbi:MAG: aldo/keto reductase [Oscillospiraceae bacterium]|jgi:predicted aldo/keto reductase-like oxidoreductase|nr:aldo/keto reductase [Oscillospiraceae bacterium]
MKKGLYENMNYRINQKNGEKISLLAFGCMRFPRDFASAEALVTTAVQEGVNYFDTAYIYHGSEVMLGRILEKNHLRSKINIATKLPTFLVKKSSDFDKYFNIQLDRLKTDYIDYYMMHMLTGPKSWERLAALGIEDWLAGKKANGAIKNIGFSYHGGAEDYKMLIDAYDWEFTMIMYNYYDVNNQAGKSGLLYAAQKNIPVMIMEPLRGGRLVYKLPEKVTELFKDLKPGFSPAEWAFRWVYSHNEVLTVLSGMENLDVLKQNIESASETNSYELTKEQDEALQKARELIAEMTEIPCTGCNYCMPCKAGVDIPLCFAHYNDIALHGRNMAFINYTSRAGTRRASLCTGCGACAGRCPQNINIACTLKTVKKKMEGGVYKLLGAIIRKFMKSS